MKKCLSCEKKKHANAFNKNKARKDGLSAYCRPTRRFRTEHQKSFKVSITNQEKSLRCQLLNQNQNKR